MIFCNSRVSIQQPCPVSNRASHTLEIRLERSPIMKVGTRLFLLETLQNRKGSKEFTLYCQVTASPLRDIQVHDNVHPLAVLVWFAPNFPSMYEVVTYYVFRRDRT